MKNLLWLTLLCCLSAVASDRVYTVAIPAPMSVAYENIYKALEARRFYVVFEPDIGKNLATFAERWGADYNRNQLDGIRSMVFCNAWYANQVGNADPSMLALCPLHITLTAKQGQTTVLFTRPSVIAEGSAAEAIAGELERSVIQAIESALPAKP